MSKKKKNQNNGPQLRETQPAFQPQPLGSKVPGIIGSLAGGTVGYLPYMVLSLTGYFAPPLAILVPVFAQLFYRRAQGYRRFSYALGTVLLSGVLIILSMDLVTQFIAMALEPSWQQAAQGSGSSLFVYLWDVILSAEGLRSLLPYLLFSQLFGLLGVALVSKPLHGYASLTAEEEKQNLQWALQQQKDLEQARLAAREKAAQKSAAKERIKADALKRLDGSAAEPKNNAPAQLTVKPYEMQQHSLKLAAAAFLAIGAAAFGFGIYKLAGGGYKFALLLLAGALLLYQGAKTYGSANRSLQLSGEVFVYRPAIGKPEEFPLADVKTCRKKGNQVTLIGFDGKVKGFFSISWQGGAELLKQLHLAKVSVTEE